MVTLVNRAKMTTSTTGTGTITLGSAVERYQSFSDAGVTDGQVVRYTIEDGLNWEIGSGTYTASGTTLTRTVDESSNGGAAISLSGNAVVFVTAAGDDLQNAADMDQGVATTDSPDFAGLTVDTVDINGGTINGTVIGGSTPAAISGTTGTFSGDLTVDTNTLFVDASTGFVGIRTNTPGQVLDVNGRADFNGRIRNNNGGSAASPSIQPGFDGDTGIFHLASNTIGFSTLGSERLRITQSGSVGIGTSSPSRSLDVVGVAAFTRGIDLGTEGVNETCYLGQKRSTVETIWGPLTTRALFGTQSNHDVAFLTNNSEAMRIDSSGNVGIGTSSPGSKLSVVGLPTSSAGLSAGDIYIDAGTLKIVT